VLFHQVGFSEVDHLIRGWWVPIIVSFRKASRRLGGMTYIECSSRANEKDEVFVNAQLKRCVNLMRGKDGNAFLDKGAAT